MNAGSCRRLTGCLSQFRLAAALHGPAGNPISDLLHAKHIVSAELWPVPIYATLQELLWWHELGFKWLPCHLHAGPFAAGGLSDRPCHLCPWCWNDPWWIYLCFYPTASIKADTLIFPTTIQGLKSCQQIRAPNWYESVACQLTNHVIKRSQRGLRNGAGPCLCSWAAMLPLDKPTPAPPPPHTNCTPCWTISCWAIQLNQAGCYSQGELMFALVRHPLFLPVSCSLLSPELTAQ